MDYEIVKATIEARMKQYQQEQALLNTEQWPANFTVDIASPQIAIRTCETILQDLATLHDIEQAQR